MRYSLLVDGQMIDSLLVVWPITKYYESQKDKQLNGMHFGQKYILWNDYLLLNDILWNYILWIRYILWNDCSLENDSWLIVFSFLHLKLVSLLSLLCWEWEWKCRLWTFTLTVIALVTFMGKFGIENKASKLENDNLTRQAGGHAHTILQGWAWQTFVHQLPDWW